MPGPKDNVGKYAVAIGSKKWKTFKEAEAYLRKNPKFLIANAGYIKKLYPAVYKAAGYDISRVTIQSGKGGVQGWRITGPGGKTLWQGSGDLYWSKDPATLKDGTDVKPTYVSKAATTRRQGQRADTGQQVQQIDPYLAALSSLTGVDVSQLDGLAPPDMKGINPSLAKFGAQPMGRADIDKLVATIVQPSMTKKLFESDISDSKKQTAHNVKQLGNWYDQVLASQGVAAQRSADFGKAAVDANTGATQAIVSSLGGEANEGSAMVGAAGAENAGLLNALGSVQNQYNADIVPLLQAEAAGQKARAQAAGAANTRALQRQLLETQTQGSAKEAELRYGIWQQNQQILNDRLARRIDIIRGNQGLKQQGFQNALGVAQARIAADATRFNQDLGLVNAAGSYMTKRDELKAKAQADLQKYGPKNFVGSSSSVKDDAWQSMLDAVEGSKLNPNQALKAMATVLKQYFRDPGSPGARALLNSAMQEWQRSS